MGVIHQPNSVHSPVALQSYRETALRVLPTGDRLYIPFNAPLFFTSSACDYGSWPGEPAENVSN